jgi:hypothetical protein
VAAGAIAVDQGADYLGTGGAETTQINDDAPGMSPDGGVDQHVTQHTGRRVVDLARHGDDVVPLPRLVGDDVPPGSGPWGRPAGLPVDLPPQLPQRTAE